MTRLTLFLVALTLNAVAGPVMATEQDAPRDAGKRGPAEADSVFQRLATEFIEAGRADGLSIAMVKDGKAKFYNFGSVSREKPQPPTEHTVYEIGSITKVFTSLILANAVTEGKVDLQDDIRHYLPGEYPKLTFEGTPVRLIHLANTTSALPDNLPAPSPDIGKADPDRMPFLAAAAFKHVTDEQVFAELKSASLIDRPGSAPRHSNLAAILMGDILEKVYGEPYETLLARYIERPLHMGPGTDHARSSITATGYSKTHAPMPPLDARSVLAAGGLRYSTADMAQFLMAELAAAGPAIQLSQQPAWGDPDKIAVGFNWAIDKTIDGQRQLRATGGTFGFSSYIVMYPERGYGIVMLTNRPGEAQSQLQDLANQALREIWGKPPALAALEAALQANGYDDVSRTVAEVKRQHRELHLTEGYVNQWGYRLLADNQPGMAVGMFRYNAEQWPNSGNAFDSLAESYERLGDVPLAISNYKRALELDPSNTNAAEHLRKLGQK